MWIEIGHFVLCSSVALTIVQIVFCIAGLRMRSEFWLPIVSLSITLNVILLLFTCLTLLYGFYVSDFSVAIIAQSSDSLKPLLFRLGSLWASYSGSMLLWCFFISQYSAVFALAENTLIKEVKLGVFLVQSIILVLFLLFLIFFANPFLRLYPAALQGTDSSALLEDINLVIHPPLLYLGYSGLSLGFSLALVMLFRPLDVTIEAVIRKYSKIAWIFLSMAMIAGSYWAYYELGWGGYWSFDPVENYALMPWLAALGGMHAKKFTWSIRFAILAFSLALIGTFFARTNFLFSVHSFVSDSLHSIAVLLLIVAIILPAIVIFYFRLPKIKLLSSGSSVLAMCLFGGLLVLITSLLFSSFTPLIWNILFNVNIFIKPSYYSYISLPVMLFLLMLMPFGNLSKYCTMHSVYYIVAAISFCTIIYYLLQHLELFLLLRLLLLGFCLLVLLIEFYNIWRKIKFYAVFGLADLSSLFAHFGIAILALGVIISSVFSSHVNTTLAIGESKIFNTMGGAFEIKYSDYSLSTAPNYEATNYIFTVRSQNQPKTLYQLTLQQRRYFRQKQQISVIALRNYGFSQLYLAAQNENAKHLAMSISYNYNILLIWLGAFISVCGAVFSLFGKLNYRLRFITKVS
ncbi:cytochrome c biogenesis protein CcsA [Bartonella sp. TP]|uniref:cytochrome c biogenesis protein CcsA n=1 Tax=Bartonella sp. TP TaxID=3057550 RepID=UPI0025B28025|nr:cytochrome c biogenesis protein CcsA [Bartonella sp. TP]WJW80169.1 cytochrome c biogenesis protein CcsA [Bartonella sp. TP]